MNITFIGTGLMGRPMALRLLHRGYGVAVYNRTSGKTRPLIEEGAAGYDTPAAAISAGDWVITMLADIEALNDTLLNDTSRTALHNRRVINMGTIAPHQARELNTAVREAGGTFMECPVLGSVPEAEHGTLILMFGGEEGQFKEALPVLQAFGPKPLHIGQVGKGSALKLAMNQLIASLTTAFSLSLALAREEGVDADKLMMVARESALYAPTYDKKLSRMMERHFDNPNFPVKHLLKDVRLFRDSAARHGLDTTVIVAMEQVLEQAVEQGLGEQDYSALYNVIHPA